VVGHDVAFGLLLDGPVTTGVSGFRRRKGVSS